MQRPRRTSELPEEPETAKSPKRQSRLTAGRFATSVGATPGAGPSKYSARQTTSITGSTTRGGRAIPTPQKTPLSTRGAQRNLFSADKKRSNAALTLHNDKKWIQERMQYITEYLKNAHYPGGMANINPEFFSRANCLKQMSIKQFMGIINYFLQFIVGNRPTVTITNYVEDIVNILQKINYPYPVNKSWLKTPTTAHSFGNAIVLFDFFMDFVEPPNDDFELEDLKPDDPSPDLEFKKLLLHNCQQSFQPWDKEVTDEFERIKRETADVLIQKRHGLAGVAAIENEITNLSTAYEKLLNDRPHIDPVEENHCQQLRKQVKAKRAELEHYIELNEKLTNQLNEMSHKKSELCAKVTQLKNMTSTLQSTIEKQECNVKGRDAFEEKIKCLRLELESKQRSLQDLQQRYHNRKTELLNMQKTVNDKIESVNCFLRDMMEILGISDDQQQFRIPFKADHKSIKRLGLLLQQLKLEIKPKLEKANEKIQKYDLNELLNVQKLKLQQEFNAKQDAFERAKKKFETYEAQTIEESKILFSKSQELNEQLNACENEKEELKSKLRTKRQEREDLKERNEATLSKLEKEHEQSLVARRERLQSFQKYFADEFATLDELRKNAEK